MMALSYVLGCFFALSIAMAASEETRKAVAMLSSEDNIVKGTINFIQEGSNSDVRVTGSISGLGTGEHGFHVHEKGDLADKCKAAGGHFNPEHKEHGGPNATIRHVGDLGNVVSNGTELTIVNITDHIISLYGVHSIIGRAIVVHERKDDFGLGNSTDSKKTGDAGGRVACGVIGIQTPVTPWNSGATNSMTQSVTTAVMSVLLAAVLKQLVM